MAVVRQTAGEGWAVIEDEWFVFGPFGDRAREMLTLFPEREDLLLLRGKIHAGRYFGETSFFVRHRIISDKTNIVEQHHHGL